MYLSSHHLTLSWQMFELHHLDLQTKQGLAKLQQKSDWRLLSSFQMNYSLTVSQTWKITYSKKVQQITVQEKYSALGVSIVWKPPSLQILYKTRLNIEVPNYLEISLLKKKKKSKQTYLLVSGLKCQAHFLKNPHKTQNTRWHSVGKLVCYQIPLLI